MLEKIKKEGKVKLPNGSFLTIEQNSDEPYNFELFIDIEKENGDHIDSVAIVRPVYVYREYLQKHPEEAEMLQFVWRKDSEVGIVKGRFEVLEANAGGDDFCAVSTLGKDKEWHNYFVLRDVIHNKQELGMAPNPAGNTELVYIPLYDGYGIQAVLDENDNEVIIGIQHGFSWWQNLCRIRIKQNSVMLECFSEYERGYMPVKTYVTEVDKDG